MIQQYAFPKHKIKVLLLENIHQAAVATFQEAGYSVTENPKSLKPEELSEAIQDVHILGIRSKTKITAEHLQQAKRLLVLGCFGVGTNQVDLDVATTVGVPVFNAPYSSTRSVAELTVGCLIMLARKGGDCNTRMHQGRWWKVSDGCYEVRDKTIGLIGYGHIGQQVGLLAESVGLQVIFYDPMKKLPLGRAKSVANIRDLLAHSDFISLHMPALQKSKVLIGKDELSAMKKGGFLLNLSRGSLVDLKALKHSLETKHLGGAALDVYPEEPKTNDEPFQCELTGMENVLLLPHIGGSTEEAQRNIGIEVTTSLIQFVDAGASIGAVNFPQLSLPPSPESHRILNIHKNIPGVLRDVNKLISDLGANVDAQHLGTYKDIGYLITDVNREVSDEVKAQIQALPSNIRTRVLY